MSTFIKSSTQLKVEILRISLKFKIFAESSANYLFSFYSFLILFLVLVYVDDMYERMAAVF